MCFIEIRIKIPIRVGGIYKTLFTDKNGIEKTPIPS